MQVLKIEGPIDIESTLECVKHLYDYPSNHHWLLDLSRAQVLLSGEEARRLGQMLRRQHEACWNSELDCHVAVVATDDLAYGLMRVVKGHADLADHLMVEVYRATAAAEQWLAAA